jgi:hypothetical protein
MPAREYNPLPVVAPGDNLFYMTEKNSVDEA